MSKVAPLQTPLAVFYPLQAKPDSKNTPNSKEKEQVFYPLQAKDEKQAKTPPIIKFSNQ